MALATAVMRVEAARVEVTVGAARAEATPTVEAARAGATTVEAARAEASLGESWLLIFK